MLKFFFLLLVSTTLFSNSVSAQEEMLTTENSSSSEEMDIDIGREPAQAQPMTPAQIEALKKKRKQQQLQQKQNQSQVTADPVHPGKAAGIKKIPAYRKPKIFESPRPYAKPSKAALTAAPDVKSVRPDYAFNFTYNPIYYVKASPNDEGKRPSRIENNFVPVFSFHDYKLTADMYYDTDLQESENNAWQMSAFIFGLRTPWDTSTIFKLSPEAILTLPLFRDKTKDLDPRMIGAAGLLATIKTDQIGLPNLILKYGIRGYKFFQKDEADEKVSTRLRQRLFLGYQLTEALTLMGYFHMDSNFLFSNEIKNAFSHMLTFEYQVNDTVGLAIGHTNGGALYRGDYQEINNLDFYSKENSEYLAGISVSF